MYFIRQQKHMFTKELLECCLDSLPPLFFRDKKVLVLGHATEDARHALARLGCHLNYLNCDVVVHCGLLSRLGYLESHLEYACQRCKYLFLETDVMDTSENICTKYTKGFSVTGANPSAAYVENLLQNYGFSVTMLKDPKLNHDGKSYDWPVRETLESHPGQRRFWICSKQSLTL